MKTCVVTKNRKNKNGNPLRPHILRQDKPWLNAYTLYFAPAFSPYSRLIAPIFSYAQLIRFVSNLLIR